MKNTNKYKMDSCTGLDIDVTFKGGAEAARTDESDEETMVNIEEVLTKKQAKKQMKEDVKEVLTKKQMKEGVKEDANKQMKDGVITMRPKLAGKRCPKKVP